MDDGALLEEICEGCTKYCTLKELMLHGGMPDRMALQLKMIERFKWEWNKGQTVEIEWDAAARRFISDGYAAKFAGIYNSGEQYHHVEAMYKNLVQYTSPPRKP